MDDPQLQDDRSFKSYRRWDPFRLPTQNEIDLVVKRRALITSVVQNDVEALKYHLDSSKYYKVTDKNGLNLLQIAILQDSKDVFDYMISLEDFPLELVSNYRETALITAILVIDFDADGDMERNSDYYALALVRRGANVFYTDHFGYTTLSCAALKHHIEMARLFIERGVSIDAQDIDGNTALHAALEHFGTKGVEMASVLLVYGSDPHIENKHGVLPFEKAVLYDRDPLVQELLFYYTFDNCGEMETRLSVLLRLGSTRSELFHKFDDVIMDDLSDTGYIQIFDLDIDFLKILLVKFKSELMEVLPKCTLHEWAKNGVTFDKIELFLESDLRDYMIECIQNIVEDDYLFEYLITYKRMDESSISSITCYLLSYGLTITEGVMQKIFRNFGYCELFKLLLHMDIQMMSREVREVMPTMLYDVSLDLQYYLRNYDKFSIRNVHLLLFYFANRKLYELCCNIYGEILFLKLDTFPKVPLLVELARNAFRKYLIRKFNIETSKQFYTLVRGLQINNIFKKIITYETKLYFEILEL